MHGSISSVSGAQAANAPLECAAARTVELIETACTLNVEVWGLVTNMTQCNLRCSAVELDRMERSAALEDSDERDTTELQSSPVIAFAAERRVADCSHPNSEFDLGTLDRDALVCNSPVQLVLAHQCTINACSALYCEFYCENLSNDASSGERAAKEWQPHQGLVSCLSVCSADAQKPQSTKCKVH